MCAGDFVEVYSSEDNAGAFDAVVTCFFIDTAHNVARRGRDACACERARGGASEAAFWAWLAMRMGGW